MGTNFKKFLGTILIMVLVLNLFVGCAKTKDENTTSESSSTPSTNKTDDASTNDNEAVTADKYKDFLTVDIFSTQANYQGIQAGWFGEFVRKKFNMDLNIIAPNVAGGGDTLFQTRSAAGNLGDIVMIGAENGRLADTVTAGLLMDMTQFTDLMPHVTQYPDAIKMLQKTINKPDGIYAIPSSVSSYPATEPSEGTEPTFGPYLRWDLYTQVGSPHMSTLEDLLPTLKLMQDAYPETESGKKTYGFSLFKDWDGNMMMMGKQPTCFYGYDEVGFLLNKADGSDISSIIESDSPYIRSLKLYFEANKMGIMDPESTTQNWDTVWNKYIDGSVLFSPWPWLGQAAYNTVEHLQAGTGFMLAPIDDMQIFSYGATPSGNKYVVGIGSKAQDPERMADFIDWLYSPEGIMLSTSQTGSTCGPEGLTWEMANNRPTLTDFGVQAMLEDGTDMPAEWGGGTWKDGVSQLNFSTVLPKDINPDNNFPYDFKLWESYLEFTATPVNESWEKEVGAISTFDLIKKNNQFIVAPGTDYIAPPEPSEISTLRAQCKAIIIENSWKMVFSNNEAEFNSLLKEMQDTVLELGYNDVLAFDQQLVDDLNAARDAAR